MSKPRQRYYQNLRLRNTIVIEMISYIGVIGYSIFHLSFGDKQCLESCFVWRLNHKSVLLFNALAEKFIVKY